MTNDDCDADDYAGYDSDNGYDSDDADNGDDAVHCDKAALLGTTVVVMLQMNCGNDDKGDKEYAV